MKMNFNPDPTKRSQKVIFSHKRKNLCHPIVKMLPINISKAPKYYTRL